MASSTAPLMSRFPAAAARPLLPSASALFSSSSSSSCSSSSSLLSPSPSASSASRASLLCPCASLSGADRVVVFLVVVAVVWLSALVLYMQGGRHSPLQPHPQHLHVINNPRGLHLPQWTPAGDGGGGGVEAAAETRPAAAAGGAGAASASADPSPPPPLVEMVAGAASAPSVEAAWAALPKPAVIVLTYNRPTYLKQALDQLHQCEGFSRFRLYVSQDGSSPDLTQLLSPYPNLTLMHRQREALLSPTQGGTAYLAQHYKWAFDELFFRRQHSHVVVVEDDMLVSPDFFLLFRDAAPLLDEDPTVFCVSSWHDNGRRGLVYDPHRLFRTSYFPGLGWMMRRALWDELHSIFPLDQWDHFMRLDTIHKQRSCIVPEISRNKNIGEQGTNMGGSFFSRFLEPIAWQQQPVRSFNRPAAPSSLHHIRQPAYDEQLRRDLEAAEVLGDAADPDVRQQLIAIREAAGGRGATGHRSIVVYKREQYHFLSDLFTLLPVPRSTHAGISVLRVAAQPRRVDEPQLTDEAQSTAADPSHWLYFINVRHVNFSKHLPAWLSSSSPHHRLVWAPHPQLQITTSKTGESCDLACQRLPSPPSIPPPLSYRCSPDHFSLLNQCSALYRHFGCERGCVGGVQGMDVPNYVTAVEKPECFHQCLTTEDTPDCAAAHWSAQRLCPCTPPSAR